MNGRTHYKVGILSCAIVSTVPLINSSPILNNGFITIPKQISLVGLAIAGIAALATDADTQHSKINNMNPVMEAAGGIIGLIESLLKIVLRLIIGVGFGILIFKYADPISREIATINGIKRYASLLTYLVASLLIFSGIANEKVLRNIPIIGYMYRRIVNTISMGGNIAKRVAMFLGYAGTGVFVIIYNFKHTHDVYIYVIGVLLISIAIFPHRSFLHSMEGLITFTISAAYLLNRFGYGQYTGCFLIGYASHIYWADIFTNSGVPLFIFPRILEKLGIKHGLVHKMAKFKLRLPPYVSTGSMIGNLFEAIYVLSLFVIAIAAYFKYHGAIRIF